MKILIVDDSAIIRAIIEQNLKKIDEKEFTIVGSVSSGKKCIEFFEHSIPDIVICDVDMPEMNGIETTKIIKSNYNVPVVILSENESDEIKAKSVNADIFILKPAVNAYNKSFFSTFVKKIKNIVNKAGNSPKIKSSDFDSLMSTSHLVSDFKILCIGASTGGPTAVSFVLSKLGKKFPLPIIYSQHIEIGADEKMAKWFDDSCSNIRVKLAEDNEEAVAGTVYMAPADKHLLIDYVKPNGNPVLKISNEPPERFLRPAVNKMFVSAAQNYKESCLAILLTGMGRDGADGCKKVLDLGGYTIVEDKSTCAVFGMPAAAIEIGGAREVLPRDLISSRILELVKK